MAVLILPCSASAEDVPPRITEYEYASAISPDEPLAEQFSIKMHLISNAGTAYCLMALDACGEIQQDHIQSQDR